MYFRDILEGPGKDLTMIDTNQAVSTEIAQIETVMRDDRRHL
jgi:hypothetical protein